MKLYTLQTLQHGRGKFIASQSIVDVEDEQATQLIASGAARKATKADIAAVEARTAEAAASSDDGGFAALNAKDAIATVDATSDPDQLTRYLAIENAREGGPRKTVVEAIEEKLAAQDEEDDD